MRKQQRMYRKLRSGAIVSIPIPEPWWREYGPGFLTVLAIAGITAFAVWLFGVVLP